MKQVFGDHGVIQDVRVDCRDSDCQKRIGFLAPRVQPAEVINALLGEVRAPMSPKELLQQLHTSQAAQPNFMAPLQIISDAQPDIFGANQPHFDPVLGGQPRQVPQAWKWKDLADRMHMKKAVIMDAPRLKAGQTACAAGNLHLCLQQNAKVAFGFLALGSILLGFISMTACMKCHRSSSARERPLQALAEPFVTDVVEDCTQAPTVLIQKACDVQPVASLEDGIPLYLARLYVRALA